MEALISDQNVEIVTRAFEALGRGDRDGVVRRFHADAVWHNTREFPGPSVCVGPQAIIDFWATLEDTWEATCSSMVIERVVDGANTVVLGIHSVLRGKTSGVPIDQRWDAAFQLREGEISRVDVYGELRRALQVAGLEA